MATGDPHDWENPKNWTGGRYKKWTGGKKKKDAATPVALPRANMLFPVLLVKVGNDNRLATTEDIDDVRRLLREVLGELADNCIVTHHAISVEQVPVNYSIK